MISKSIVTVSALVLSIIGCLPFIEASSNIKNNIFNHHYHSTLTTCIDQSVFKHIIDDDDNEYDAQDVSYSLHNDNMMLSKVVLNADNGTCDIAMGNDGLTVIMAYHPAPGYLGQDKCVYEMCIVAEEEDEESGAMDTEQCHHETIAIHVDDCSSSSSLITAVLQDEEDDVAVVKALADHYGLEDSKVVRCDIFVVCSHVYMMS